MNVISIQIMHKRPYSIKQFVVLVLYAIVSHFYRVMHTIWDSQPTLVVSKTFASNHKDCGDSRLYLVSSSIRSMYYHKIPYTRLGTANSFKEYIKIFQTSSVI